MEQLNIPSNPEAHWIELEYRVPSLRVKALGDAAPVMRLEALYQIDKVFVRNGFDENHDYMKAGLGFDWRFRVPWQEASIWVFPQFFYDKIRDYDGVQRSLSGRPDDTTELLISMETTYFRTKIKPSVIYWRKFEDQSDLWNLDLKYDWTNKLTMHLGAWFFEGSKDNWGFKAYDNKDYIYFKIAKQFG